MSEIEKETLEEAKQRILDSNYITKNDADIFEMGAKWQAERMYSEKEMFAIIAEILHTPKLRDGGWEDIFEWFE